MCARSEPHQSLWRIRGRSLLWGVKGAQRAGKQSTCCVHRAHQHTAKQCPVSVCHKHTYRVAGDASLSVCFSLSGSVRETVHVCAQSSDTHSLLNMAPSIQKKQARGSGMNKPFHCFDVNIVTEHDFSRAGKNDCIYSQPIFWWLNLSLWRPQSNHCALQNTKGSQTLVLLYRNTAQACCDK